MKNGEEKSDIEIVREQTLFLLDVCKQLTTKGKITLETGDLSTVEEVAQSLNIFRMYLIMLESGATAK